MRYLVRYACLDGGHGWGETGATRTIIFNEFDKDKFNGVKPGGWIIHSISEFKCHAQDLGDPIPPQCEGISDGGCCCQHCCSCG